MLISFKGGNNIGALIEVLNPSPSCNSKKPKSFLLKNTHKYLMVLRQIKDGSLLLYIKLFKWKWNWDWDYSSNKMVHMFVCLWCVEMRLIKDIRIIENRRSIFFFLFCEKKIIFSRYILIFGFWIKCHAKF